MFINLKVKGATQYTLAAQTMWNYNVIKIKTFRTRFDFIYYTLPHVWCLFKYYNLQSKLLGFNYSGKYINLILQECRRRTASFICNLFQFLLSLVSFISTRHIMLVVMSFTDCVESNKYIKFSKKKKKTWLF